MLRYGAKRIVMAVPVLIGVVLLTFLMLHFVPGDPVKAMFIQNGGATQSEIDQVRHQLGLDKPLPVQFWDYLVDVLHGNLGTSIRTNEGVGFMLVQNFPPTMELALAGLGLAIVIGFAFGIVAAVNRGSWIDSVLLIFSLSGVSIPSFWLGLLLIYVFSVHFHWIPIVGGPGWKELILPAIALGLQSSAIIARLVRSSLLEVLQEQYVVTARAKGVAGRQVLFVHALRNALLPVVTIVGLQFGGLLSGTVIIETVFARQGIGRILVDALQARDFPTAQGAVLFIAVIYVLVNLIVDLLYGVIDPRITAS